MADNDSPQVEEGTLGCYLDTLRSKEKEIPVKGLMAVLKRVEDGERAPGLNDKLHIWSYVCARCGYHDERMACLVLRAALLLSPGCGKLWSGVADYVGVSFRTVTAVNDVLSGKSWVAGLSVQMHDELAGLAIGWHAKDVSRCESDHPLAIEKDVVPTGEDSP